MAMPAMKPYAVTYPAAQILMDAFMLPVAAGKTGQRISSVHSRQAGCVLNLSAQPMPLKTEQQNESGQANPVRFGARNCLPVLSARRYRLTASFMTHRRKICPRQGVCHKLYPPIKVRRNKKSTFDLVSRSTPT